MQHKSTPIPSGRSNNGAGATVALYRCTQIIDSITEFCGKLIAWFSLALMVVTCVVVVMRYFLSTGSIALQESITYLHASLFMLGAAFTLKRGGHVRVDIFYRRMSARGQALVDIIGGLVFLVPVCALILWLCWDYVGNSWAISEASSEGSGLPFVYLLKTLLLIMPVTLLFQGVAEIIKNLLFVLGPDGAHAAEKVETV